MIANDIRALILYTYSLGGNTREIARITGLPHNEIADALALAAHEDAMKATESAMKAEEG